MNENDIEAGDPDLVAFVHGELDADAERAVRARLAADPELRAQHAALVAVDRALGEELETPRSAPGRLHRWWRPLLAAAALLVVGLVLVLPRDDGDDDVGAAHNEMVGLRVRPVGGAEQPVFCDAGLELAWQNRLTTSDARRLKVLPYHFADTLESLGRAEAADPDNARSIVPLVVAAVLHAPDGSRLPARLAAPIAFVHAGVPHLQIERLWSFEIETDAPPPYLGGRPGDREWVDDFLWSRTHMPTAGPRRWLVDQIGGWTIELHVTCVPPPTPGLWPTFPEPLVVATKVIATGIASQWGAAHDGMQARLVLATGCEHTLRAPLALQLRNTAGEAYRYNVVGTTMAKIPQPFHFHLVFGDGDTGHTPTPREGTRAGLGVQIGDLMVPHPAGTVRSLVVRADYWNAAAAALAQPAGTTIVGVFHFEPTFWVLGEQPKLWQGRLTSGPLVVPPRDPR